MLLDNYIQKIKQSFSLSSVDPLLFLLGLPKPPLAAFLLPSWLSFVSFSVLIFSGLPFFGF
jgi:hypothetical protein